MFACGPVCPSSPEIVLSEELYASQKEIIFRAAFLKAALIILLFHEMNLTGVCFQLYFCVSKLTSRSSGYVSIFDEKHLL